MSTYETLDVDRRSHWLHVTLNRPKRRNAMNRVMVEELMAVASTVRSDRSIRAVILRGAQGHFCAGGDVSDMAGAMGATSDGSDPIAELNRLFGHMLTAIDELPCAVVAVCEGAVMGGGFGLACVADVTLASASARFRLPETSLGITPAQIAPFIVRRVGHSHARRLAVTGQTLKPDEAVRLGLAHIPLGEDADIDTELQNVLSRIRRCEPTAVAATKRLVDRAGSIEFSSLLDDAASEFSTLVRRPEAKAGMTSFLTRKPAPWDQED